MGTKCYNGGNKHKFQPRYDEVELSNTPDVSAESFSFNLAVAEEKNT